MKLKKTKKQISDQLRKRARELYASGYTTREVGDLLKPKRSHAWVASVVKKDLQRLDRGAGL